MLEFSKAVSVWIKDKENEMNHRVRFKTIINCETFSSSKVLIATSGIYNLYINGVFVAYGPARAGRGHFRIDEIDVSQLLSKGKNSVVIEVCGYNSASFYIQKYSSFLTAEVYIDKKAVAWTGKDFTAQENPHYIQKSQRYSYQRPMVEAYNIKNNDNFLENYELGNEEICEVSGGIYLPRLTKYPLYEEIEAVSISNGDVEYLENVEITYDRSVTQVGEELSGFAINELEAFPTSECEHFRFLPRDFDYKKEIQKNTYKIYEFPFCTTGMLNFQIECMEDLTLYILFDEVLTDGLVDFLRGDCANVIKYTFPKGKHSIRFFEVYTMKYVQAVALGDCRIENIAMTEYKHPPIDYDTSVFPEKIKKIADAAIESFRQNSVDLFSDCPSRERAGWLCDSYFTAQTEYLLLGNNNIEKCFLENFLHEEDYIGLPKGMVPMCYPADSLFGMFIPQWSLWLLLELEKYFERTADYELIEKFKYKTEKLLKYFTCFENSDGLLEKLGGWQFVEWSKANDLVDDVNYPTNMLYSRALKSVAKLYNRPELEIKAENIKKTVLEQSFNGEFFCDNAIRKNGELALSGESTEVCQYYAFFFNIADKESHGKLLESLIEHFGPSRDSKYENIHPANAFIGNYLRLEILMGYGEFRKALENISDYFSYMAERTGTLWENTGATASCNHGFASYVLCWLDELKNKIMKEELLCQELF